jgi:3-methylfumaryl-CoA hydratase
MNSQPSTYESYVGNQERLEEDITLFPVQAMRALLDEREPELKKGDPLPPFWQYLYFLPRAPQSKIGSDGHPERGGFLPPVTLPRRMFAGGRQRFPRPLVIGRPAERLGTILSVSEKHGQSGSLVFVTVRYEFRQDGEVCVEEEQDIVYREAGGKVPAPSLLDTLPDLPAGAFSRIVTPDPVLLFRFSALSFNAHRIHIDRNYAMQEEGYPGLVVHGPLTAMLLLDLARRHTDHPVKAFTFRGKAPLFDLAPFRLAGLPEGDLIALEAQGPDGKTAMTATVELG